MIVASVNTLDMEIIKRTTFLLLVIACLYICTVPVLTLAAQGKDYSLSKLITLSSDSDLIVRYFDSYNKKTSSNIEPHHTDKNEYIVSSMKANNIRMTMGTAILNAIHIKVTDENDNPIPYQIINISKESDVVIAPGWLEGSFLPDMKTNVNGEFVGMVVSTYRSRLLDVISNVSPESNTDQVVAHTKVIYGKTGVRPSIDELDERITGEVSRQVMIEVAGTELAYNIDIDMGPALVISNEIDSMFYSAQWIGMETKDPVGMTLVYFQRVGECQKSDYIGGSQSAGIWLDEDFSLTRIRKVLESDVPYTVGAERYDRNSNSIKLLAADDKTRSSVKRLDADEEGTKGNNKTLMRHRVVMDHVMGEILVTYTIPEIIIDYKDDRCNQNGSIYKTPVYKKVIKKTTYPVSNTIPLRSVSPRVNVVVQDYMPPEPVNDPLPQIKSYSGMNVDKLVIRLNNKVIFGDSIKNIELDQYPNYIQAISDNEDLSVINEAVLNKLSPGIFEFVYYPTFEEVKIGGKNVVKASGIEDRVGNTSPDKISTFTIP